MKFKYRDKAYLNHPFFGTNQEVMVLDFRKPAYAGTGKYSISYLVGFANPYYPQTFWVDEEGLNTYTGNLK